MCKATKICDFKTEVEIAMPLTTGISYCCVVVCGHRRSWLLGANLTPKRIENATAHTGKR